MTKKLFVHNVTLIYISCLLFYGFKSFVYANTRTNSVNGASHTESLRTRPRQARLALQELNLIPGPDEEQRQNDKFLKNLPKVNEYMFDANNRKKQNFLSFLTTYYNKAVYST